jgi:hypothetical protein
MFYLTQLNLFWIIIEYRLDRLCGPPSLLSNGYRGSLVKREGREADHSPPASAEVKKNVNLYSHSPIRLHGVVLNYLSTGTTFSYLTVNRVPLTRTNWLRLLRKKRSLFILRIIQCSPLKDNRRFGGICHLHVQGPRIRKEKNSVKQLGSRGKLGLYINITTVFTWI